MKAEDFFAKMAKPYIAAPLAVVAFGAFATIKILTSKTHEERVKEFQEQ